MLRAPPNNSLLGLRRGNVVGALTHGGVGKAARHARTAAAAAPEVAQAIQASWQAGNPSKKKKEEREIAVIVAAPSASAAGGCWCGWPAGGECGAQECRSSNGGGAVAAADAVARGAPPGAPPAGGKRKLRAMRLAGCPCAEGGMTRPAPDTRGGRGDASHTVCFAHTPRRTHTPSCGRRGSRGGAGHRGGEGVANAHRGAARPPHPAGAPRERRWPARARARASAAIRGQPHPRGVARGCRAWRAGAGAIREQRPFAASPPSSWRSAGMSRMARAPLRWRPR